MAGQNDSGLHDSVELKDVLGRAQKTGYEDSMTPAEPPLIVRNGLTLKRQATGKSEDFGSYTYALSPLTTAPRSVDWKIVAFSGADIVCEHIYCHEVKPDDNLDDLIAECRSNHAVAVILLNCDESYSLPKTIQSSFTKTDYPVLVLAAEDGRKLLKTLLEEDEDGDFLAKVLEKEPIEQLPKQPEPKSKQGKVLELCKDFKKQTRQLLHPSGHATCVSEDSELLKQVADVFDHYEQEVQKLGPSASLVSNHCICEDLKKWRDKCDFGREFPLYLVLVYRLMRKRVVYICNHFDGFIYHTVLKIEELPWRVVASTVETLVSRGNFQIKCQGLAPEKNAVGVITFLGEACEQILCIPFSESQPRKTKGAGKVHRTPIATKMFWTSLAVKFRSHGECQVPPNYLWQENIVKGCEDLVLKDDVISAMGSGLDFGRLLKLSPEVAFGSLQISQFLALPTFVRPFKHIRTFLKEVNLSNYINEEVDLANLMQSLLDSYRMWIAQHPDDTISQLSTQKRLDEAISEGIAFLDELYTIKYQKQWNSKDSELAEKFYRWLIFLIRLVDVRKPNAEQCLRLFLEYRSRFCKEHKKKIIARVKMLIKEKFQEITIQQFYCLYKVFFRYWEPEFLKDYLMNVKFQEDDRISPSWSDFFQEVMKHLTDPQNHQFLFEFLKRTGEHYAMKHSRFEFLADLLVLKVPEPCTQEHSKTDIPSEFYAFLQCYFCDEHLVDKMSEFLGCLSQEKSCHPFMDIIMTLILQDIFQKPVTTLLPPLKTVVKEFTSKKRLDIKIHPSPQELFCWKFLSGCCSQIMSTKDLNWVESDMLQPIILELANVCQCYFTTKEWTEKECLKVICDSKSLPEEIAASPKETVKYFEWVRSAQVYLNGWYTKLSSWTVNYDDVIHYEQRKPCFLALAKKIFASRLLFNEALLKQHFEQLFEELHLLMLRYIDGDPDGRWCTLSWLLRQYGVMIPQHIQEPLEKYIRFPNENVSLLDPFLKNPLPPSINRKFQLIEKGVTPTLEATTGLTFKKLDELIRHLRQFLRPINSYLDMLAFFTLHQSQMFRTYVKYQLKRVGNGKDACTSLQNALVSTSLLIWNIVDGKAKYGDIVAGRTLDLETLDIDKELRILVWWVFSENPDRKHVDFSPKLKAHLLLSRIVTNIDAILNVCTIYELQVCLSDENLRNLVDLANILKDDRERDELSLEDASEYKNEVEKLLCLQTDSDYKCLDLFPVVADSKDFFQFIQKRHFVGREGQRQFRTLLELITAQLQHDSDEYEQTVLNHLSAAFQLIAPFTDSSQTFRELMSEVVKLDISNGLMQLKTVKNNLHLIELWISRAEGDTLQNAITDLENILQTGWFKFLLNPEGIGGVHAPPQVILEYSPIGPDTQQSAGGGGHVRSEENLTVHRPSCVAARKERWDSGEISNFVQMLGLLDQGKSDHTAKIMKFQSLNETAEKLLALFTTLKELGHPDFLHETLPAKDLVCSASVENAEKKVDEARSTLDDWKKQVEEWHSQYPCLLFFSIPKLLRLHESLFNIPQPDESGVANGITFFFSSSEAAQSQLKSSVKKVLSQQLSSSAKPMPRVGEFLKSLLQDVDLKCYFMPRRYIPNNASNIPASKPSWSARQLKGVSVELHYTPGFNKLQLLSTIIGIYSGVPESFEFFRCSADTTELELKKFVERVWKYSRTYLMFGVNNLPLHLQEVFVQHLEGCQQTATQTSISTLHCLEMSPSSLREIPWIQVKEYQATHPPISLENARDICRDNILISANIEAVHLIYGQPGDGKTHFVKRVLRERSEYHSTTITVNEGFTTKGAILELLSIPENAKCPTVFFNFTFTLLPPDYEDCEPKEREQHKTLISIISWFFFDLFVFGYVEDRDTGLSFRLPGGQSWTVYVEVPCSCWPDNLSLSVHESETALEKSLNQFQSEIPVFGLLGSPHLIDHGEPLVADGDVQLICKYLRAYHDRTIAGIDRLYVETTGLMKKKEGKPIKFSTDRDMSEAECNKYLGDEMSKQIKKSKIIQKLYIRYMHRRCEFLDNCPSFNFNRGLSVPNATDTSQLGSTLMRAMLTEVADFCSPEIQKNWSCKPHQQLIYDFTGGGGALGYISLNPDEVPQEEKLKLRKIGIKLPSDAELHTRKYLDELLSRALGLPFEDKEDGQICLPLIDESSYVLTLDYAIKMLSIHERRECGMPVIIEGETGVGKTALVEMLSKLWNYSWNSAQRKNKYDLLAFLLKNLQDGGLAVSDSDYYKAKLTEMIATEEVKEDVLDEILQLPDAKRPQEQFYLTVRDHLLKHIRSHCPINLLKPRKHKEIRHLFDSVSEKLSKETTLELLSALLIAEMKQTFYRLQVHAALQPKDVWEFFDAVILQAEDLQAASSTMISTEHGCSQKPPVVTVFLDELNTSTCGGIFKEIIVDRTMNGKDIPFNVFIIAACNPHRGNSLAPTRPDETWVRGFYYVHRLHPTLRYLMWDYGALNELQERRYIEAKVKLLHSNLSNPKVDILAEHIVQSQNLIRQYAQDQLLQCNLQPTDAEAASRSTVSQRDIQRFFTFYQWLLKMHDKLDRHEESDRKTRAMLVALSIVYYMRLNSKYRECYQQEMEELAKQMGAKVTFAQAFQDELEWLISEIDLPPGIARTQALKENIFAIVICVMTCTPLILVGAPGSSKTLSFHLVTQNLRGKESDVKVFQSNIFSSVDPHFYQCSRQTTSHEINSVFSRAINRQSTYREFALPIKCVILMDEAGLPEESLESLKALHYHLDQQEVSFVAITNHILDAAKSNRAVSLVVTEPSKEDLIKLAKDCFCDPYNIEVTSPQTASATHSIISHSLDHKGQTSPVLSLQTFDYARQSANEYIERCCVSYFELMKQNERCDADECGQRFHYPFHKFFGLRDFIHFLGYLRRKLFVQSLSSVQFPKLTNALVLEGLERNFNGTEDFDSICAHFIKVASQDPEKREPVFRSTTEILRDSLSETPVNISGHGEVRYKLIIDPSEDNSLIRYLFKFGTLEEGNAHVHMCSDLGDSHVDKINTIASICHSALEGHTVLLSQVDKIQDSFYDLFNQRFRCIKNPVTNEHRYYANIAIGAHSKPSRVSPKFQCIVLLKESELSATPAPFLNRFEKYRISYTNLIKESMNNLPRSMRIMMEAAIEKVKEFVKVIEASHSLYGFREDTVSSLLLRLLPPPLHKIQASQHFVPPCVLETKASLLNTILDNLRQTFGFYIPQMSDQELTYDAEHLFGLAQSEILYSSLDELNITTSTVSKALNILITTPYASQSEIVVTDDIGLIFRLLVQWFTHYLCKTLMQLMTPEALALFHKRIPEAYVWSYLVLQEHFSLKWLLSHYCELLQSSRRTNTRAIRKLLCFNHSLPKLPQFFSRETGADRSMVSYLEEVVFSSTDQLVIVKLSVSNSQRNVRELLKKFSLSQHDRVLLLAVNTLEVSPDAINHLRIMIEEVEALPSSENKLFVLLLQISDVVLGRVSYPSLFLEGWSHHYISSIPTAHPEYVADTKQWFMHSFFPEPKTHLSTEDRLLVVLKDIFPILTSRVGFTASADETNHAAVLSKLLFDHNSCIGKALCSRFLTYWTPPTTAEYLHRAAYSIQKSDSTLRLSDTLHKMFKSKLFDYFVYMVSKIHADCNIQDLVQHEPPHVVKKVFVDIIKAYPAPKLSQLKLNSMLGVVPSAVTCYHSFPYFSLLSELVDGEIALCKQFSPQFDLPLNDCEPHYPSEQADVTEFKLVNEAKRRLLRVVQDEDPPCLAVTLKQMAESEQLWCKYFSDFACEKLHVRDNVSGPIMAMLRSWHQKKVDQNPNMDAMEHVLTNIASLHVSVLHLSEVTSILRPIADLETMAQQIPPNISKGKTGPPHLEIKGSIFERPEAMCLYVVDSLFQPLAQILIGQTSVEVVSEFRALWNAVYQKIMSIPQFKKWIYEHLSPQTEGKLNLMHAAYLVHQFDPTEEECKDLSNLAFTSLYNRHFEPEKDKIKAGCPHLQQLIDVVLGVLMHKNTKYIAYVVEGLLEHCFSEYRKEYHPEDIRWFLELVNQQLWDEIYPTGSTIKTQICDLLKFESFTEHFPSGCISLNVFKFYLSRILSKCKAVSSRLSVVVPWNNETRLEIGRVLVAAKPSYDPPGSYVPPFYANHYTGYAQNVLMRQPLAHLYFYMTLEHLMSSFFKQKISSMLEFVAAIEKEHQCTKEDHERVMLLIEKQALVQVLIRESAHALATNKGRQTIVVVKDDLNHLLNNEKMGGTRVDGKVSGHGVTLAMHTIRQMKSIENFLNLPDGSILRDINCLKPFLSSDVERLNMPSCHLFPFMLPGGAHSQTTLSNLYQQLCRVMYDLHRSGGVPTKVQALFTFTEKKLHRHLPLTSSYGIETEKTACVRLMLWLCTYHEFYDKNVKSEALADAINESEMVELLGGKQYAHLICCFLNPDLMISKNEDIDISLRHIPKRELDAVYELFHPSYVESLSPSDLELRHAVANIIAAVLGTPENSTHLWLHMFSPNDLDSTYMTGFMFDAPVSRQNGMFYNFGTGLQPKSGIYAKHSYLKHATRGTLNLHSLYLLLWANFCAFCVSLLTSQNAELQLTSLLSDDLPVRALCVSRLRSLWTHMRNSLHVLDEGLAYLIQKCSEAIIRESIARRGTSNGRFGNKEDLDAYEHWWHKRIFMPSKQELDEKFLTQYDHKSFAEIRQMEIKYPKFPTEDDFLQYILNVASSEEDPCIHLLSQFALEYPRLELARSLLPQLVELYWWLHTELAHMISSDTAKKTTVKQLMKHLENYYRNDPDKKQRLTELFHSVKDNFNQFARITGVAPDDTGALPNPRVFTIEDNTLVIQLLSVPLQSDNTTNDQLYRVIVDLVKIHNHIVEMLAQAADSCPHELLHRHILADSTKVHLLEVSDSNSAVENFSKIYDQRKFLQLLRRRCILPTIGRESPAVFPQFDLHLLLQDIVTVFLSGKPQIHNPSAHHIPYCFRVPPNHTRAHLSENGAQELANINHKLPQEYKEPLGGELLKNLEYRFHKATLETYDEVVTGLTTVAQYLIESLCRNGDIGEANTLQCFLCEVYQCEEESNVAFKRAGITSLSSHQLSCFLDMKLQNVYHTLQIFVQWIEDGYYDFQSLPYATKSHLHEEDEKVLWQLQQHYTGSPMELLQDLKDVTVLLNQLEPNIVEIVSSNPQEPINNLLKAMHMQKEARKDKNELMLILPQSIQVNQYVALRVTLRRLTLEVEKCLPAKQRQEDGHFGKFKELVTDLWKKAHVRRVPGGSSSSDDSHLISREPSSVLDYSDDDHLDDYSDDSSYAATTWQPSEEEDFSADEWIEEKPHDILAAILESINLSHHIDLFTEEEVAEDNLHVFANDDLLKSIGIISGLDRLKIILQIQKHKSGPKSTQEHSVEKVIDFLRRTPDMEQYISYFEEKQIDGDLLLAATDEVLQELGIDSAFHRLKIRICFQREVRGPSALALQYPVGVVVALLKANNMDAKYQLVLETHKIDGELLVEASDQVLREIGIKSRIHQHNIKKLIQK